LFFNGSSAYSERLRQLRDSHFRSIGKQFKYFHRTIFGGSVNCYGKNASLSIIQKIDFLPIVYLLIPEPMPL
jgi:hypothetical protein